MLNDFDDSILEITGHRPWPLPDAPWIMTQTWHDLLFAHWPVAAGELRALVPAGFEVDLHEGQAWAGVVPFRMTNVAPRGVPAMPWVSAFPELNVRTYVRVGGKPGVFFFSLDAGNALVAAAARTLFHLPYFAAEMSLETAADGFVDYHSRRTSADGPAAELRARYRPTGPVQHAVPGSLDYFLTERYCLFTLDSSRHPCIVEIHHPPWRLQPAEAELPVNTMAAAAGLRLADMAPVLHFSRRQDMVAWPLRSIAREV
jgi:uncharacterized protein YqjF (DUF2071 family)